MFNPLSRFPIEIVTYPTIPDNIDHWQIFSDDEKILRFIRGEKELCDLHLSPEQPIYVMPMEEEDFGLRDLMHEVPIA